MCVCVCLYVCRRIWLCHLFGACYSWKFTSKTPSPSKELGPKSPTVKDTLKFLAVTHPHHAWHCARSECTVAGFRSNPTGARLSSTMPSITPVLRTIGKGWHCVKCGKIGTMNHFRFLFQEQLAKAGLLHLGCVAWRRRRRKKNKLKFTKGF